MKAYITTKVVLAEPQNNPSEYAEVDEPGYKVVYPDGYVSWCPKEVFERASREVIATEKSLIFQETVLLVDEPDEDEDESGKAEVATE